MTRTRNVLLTAAALGVVFSACGTNSTTAKSSAPANAFVLTEWAITPPTARLQAGQLQISATNNGSETHELVIVRAPDPASLPTKTDGSVDEDKIPETDKAGEIPDLAPGKTVTTTLDLAAGRYLAVCNLVDQMGQDGNMGGGNMGGGAGMGHVHFRLGMVTQFTVT